MFPSRITRPCATAALLLAVAVAGGCETDHTTPEAGRNPPPPPQRMPRAVEMSRGTGVHLLSNEISDEEAEKLKQGSTQTDPTSTSSAPEEAALETQAAPEDGATE